MLRANKLSGVVARNLSGFTGARGEDVQPQPVQVADGAEFAAGPEAVKPLPVRSLAGMDGLPLQTLVGVHLPPSYARASASGLRPRAGRPCPLDAEAAGAADGGA